MPRSAQAPDRHTGRMLGWLIAAAMVGCGPAANEEMPFDVEVFETAPATQVDTLAPPAMQVLDRRVAVDAVMGLGGAGYQLSATGSVADGVIEILVTARLPEDVMGATVLTTYGYRVTSGRLSSGRYRVVLRHAMEGGGTPELVGEQEVEVP